MDAILLDLSSAGIHGECQLTGYANAIELLSFSLGVAQQIVGDPGDTKRTSGKPNRQDFTATKYADGSSGKLIDLCNRAVNIPTAKIVVGREEDGRVTKIFEYELSNVLISSVAIGGAPGDRQSETVTFSYAKISWVYAPQTADAGDDSGTWNLATNANA